MHASALLRCQQIQEDPNEKLGLQQMAPLDELSAQ